MSKAIALFVVLVIPLPALASGWSGSLDFSKRGSGSQWSGSLSQGQNVIRTDRGVFHAVRDRKKVTLFGAAGTGKGTIHRGHFTGTIKYRDGTKGPIHAAKSGGNKSGGKKGR